MNDAALAALGTGMLALDGHLTIVEVSGSLARALSIEPAELLGRPVAAILSTEHRRESAAWMRFLSSGDATSGDMPAILVVAGTSVLTRMRAIAHAGGWWLLVERISAETNLTHRLLAARERWSRIIADADDGIAIVDENGILLQANLRFFELVALRSRHGISLAQAAAVGRPLQSLVEHSRLPGIAALTKGIVETRAATLTEADADRVDGAEAGLARRFRVRASPVSLAGAAGLGMVLVVTEVTAQARLERELVANRELAERLSEELTERTRVEHELRQAQKLEAVGRLAAGIAHEINTPMQYVGDNIFFLRQCVERLLATCDAIQQALDAEEIDPVVRGRIAAHLSTGRMRSMRSHALGACDSVKDGIAAVTAIVSTLDAFSHASTDAPALLDVNDLVGGVVTLSRHECVHLADIALELDLEAPRVTGYAAELSQAIHGLLLNAAQAIADAGRGSEAVVVSTRALTDTVEVRVRDRGCGIPLDIRHRVFDPFFTTRAVGQGAGQGLAVARAVIVGKHGGDLSFESELGVGTTFTIRLPRAGMAGSAAA